MNAAVRAVARTAFFLSWEVSRVEAGYKGLLEGQIGPMNRRRLGGIVQRGGTMLGTQRSEEFPASHDDGILAGATLCYPALLWPPPFDWTTAAP